jgi:NAD(P)-dependent dehydrogenase (short-subunit alcohol dehydrogenase family)
MSLVGLVVLITGAASGIGAATAKELHARGARPVLVDCDELPLREVAAQCGGTLSCVADVTSLPAMERVVSIALEKHGRIDVVWANAGIAAFGPLAYTDPAAWHRCLDVNVIGVFNTVRAALPAVMKQGGYVLISASVSSFAHPPAISAYAASKAAVEAMGNSWRIELRHHGVAVGLMHAGWVKTPLVSEGAMHPGFGRLRATMPGFLNAEMTVERAARAITNGISQRRRTIWIPGWIRMLHILRAFLHAPLAEREMLRAAPEIESLYLEGLACVGPLASTFGPRERERTLARSAAASAEKI